MIAPAAVQDYPKRARNRTFILGFLSGAIVVALVAFGLSLGQGEQPTTAQTAGQAPAGASTAAQPPGTTANQPPTASTPAPSGPVPLRFDMARRIDGDITALGPVDAPLVIVEYADYRCPYCSMFEVQTMPMIVGEYIDAGLVRFEFRDMPIFGDQSIETAIAGRAAGAQGKFWEFKDAIAANGVVEGGHPDLPRERLIAFAEQVGVPDIAKFTADLDSPEIRAAVEADLAEAQGLGVSSVPAFLIGDTGILGAQPFEVFRDNIERELVEAGVER